MTSPRNKSTIWIHVLAWTIFICYEVPIAAEWGPKAGIDEYVCFYILDVFLFYINAAIVIRGAENKRTIIKELIPLMLIELVTFFTITLVVGVTIYKFHNHWSAYTPTKDDMIKALWRCIYITMLSTGYAFFKREIRVAKQRNEVIEEKGKLAIRHLEMEKDLIKSKNAFLQAQINRHLLFNTLNFIYNSVFKIAPDAGNSVMLLSETMQYALQKFDNGIVPISKEIEQIERYIALNSLRFEQPLRLRFSTELCPDAQSVNIPPLLLLTFVENIYKHGDLVNHTEFATITISCDSRHIGFYTSNFKKGRKHPAPSSHIGISNARTRLESYYGAGNFRLNLSETENEFMVELFIRL